MEKFIGFARGLLTNRLGIVFAALNLCYFASKISTGGHFALSNFDKIMLSQNLPAGVLTFVSTEFVGFIFSKPLTNLHNLFGLSLLLFFVTLQWLFIGWSAKMIARRIRMRAETRS